MTMARVFVRMQFCKNMKGCEWLSRLIDKLGSHFVGAIDQYTGGDLGYPIRMWPKVARRGEVNNFAERKGSIREEHIQLNTEVLTMECIGPCNSIKSCEGGTSMITEHKVSKYLDGLARYRKLSEVSLQIQGNIWGKSKQWGTHLKPFSRKRFLNTVSEGKLSYWRFSIFAQWGYDKLAPMSHMPLILLWVVISLIFQYLSNSLFVAGASTLRDILASGGRGATEVN